MSERSRSTEWLKFVDDGGVSGPCQFDPAWRRYIDRLWSSSISGQMPDSFVPEPNRLNIEYRACPDPSARTMAVTSGRPCGGRFRPRPMIGDVGVWPGASAARRHSRRDRTQRRAVVIADRVECGGRRLMSASSTSSVNCDGLRLSRSHTFSIKARPITVPARVMTPRWTSLPMSCKRQPLWPR